MKTRFIYLLFGLFLSQAVMANLDGDWSGMGFAKTTLKAQGLTISSFAITTSQLTVDSLAKTMIFTDDVGTSNGVFREKITRKWGMVQKHTFTCRLDKTALQSQVYDALSAELSEGYLLSNLKISSANANGEELNESDEDANEDQHALHGVYKINVTFKVAEAENPRRKVSFSLVFDVDFGLTHSTDLQPLNASPAPLNPPRFENAAKLIKQLLTLINNGGKSLSQPTD